MTIWHIAHVLYVPLTQANCDVNVCENSLLYVGLFKRNVCAPANYVAATVALRKKCKSLKGEALHYHEGSRVQRERDRLQVHLRGMEPEDAGTTMPKPVLP